MAAEQHNDMQAHVKSYSLFSWIIKWGAVVSLITALLIIFLISD